MAVDPGGLGGGLAPVAPRAPRGKDRDQHVAGSSKAQHLSFEDPIIAVIIGELR